MSIPGSGATDRRQKRMGPAPFASFEDLSDELESPDDKNPAGSVVRLPGIREDATPTVLEQPEFVYTGISLVGASTMATTNGKTEVSRLQTPNTPRIDISRASSSSHHDSRDSTPERELFEHHDPATAKLGLGFREEGALDLRSSTEELDFQDPQDVKRKGKARPPSPSLHDESHHQRKDSQSSELGLLCISGRTSRLSSIGSQGSGHSRLSNASHLSVISGQSGLSRSPSPHKMLLETSFCGTKPPKRNETTTEHIGTKMEAEVMEKVLLSRKQDPTQAVLAEGISVRKVVQSVKSDITIKVDEPQISNNSPNIPRKFVTKSGVEYIYIPLKGPLPVDNETKPKIREIKSATIQSKKQVPVKAKAKSATPSPIKKEDHPKYIRIKLKPDYMYSQEDDDGKNTVKPDSLDLKQDQGISMSSTPSASPKITRPFLKDSSSKTPSPSLSRKSSFASIFRSKETILSPESPTAPSCRRKNTITGILREASESLRDRSRSRSKSRERDRSLSTAPSSTESIDSKKQKSVFSRFKSSKKDSSSSSEVTSIDGIAKVEFKFNDRKLDTQGDSIRIPLHSPDHYEERTILQDVKTSSQDSQDTVIEVCRKVEAIVETVPKEVEINKNDTKRQSSTSSDNVVFSTKLENEIFCTKLPKDKSPEIIQIETPVKTPIPDSPQSVIAKVITPPDNMVQKVELNNRNSTIEDERCSSESERDSEADFARIRKDLDLKLDLEYLEPERKGLVVQQDSYEDELPYIPTTLPMERSAAVPIVPIKQRSTFEMKTYPIERPRSTTPINPSCLEEYCEEVLGNFNSENITKTIEKLKISLPKHDSIDKSVKSPRKPSNSSWFEFAEKGITARRSSLTQESETPPPLPPKGVQKEWINFEEIPERRKPPKRIQTLPSRRIDDADNVVYNYVNPEECKCECHEVQRREKEDGPQEDEMPLLDDEDVSDNVDRLKLEDRRSIISDSSIDLSTTVEPEANGVVKLNTPFTSDLGVSSNRSSVISQDEPESLDSGSPNAFPKMSQTLIEN